MGLTHRDWVWSNAGYSGDRFNALLYVAERCNEQNLVWRGREDIAYYTNQSVRSVEKSLAVFVKDGVLSVEQIGRGRGNTTVYRFNPPKVWKAPARRKAALSHLELKGEDISPFSSAGKGELESIKGELDDTEKANLVTEKANLVTSHIRNNRHEPKEEPKGGTRARAQDPPPADEASADVEAMVQAVTAVTGVRATSWQQADVIRGKALELCQVTTPEQLRRLHRNRGRPYKLNWVVNDVQEDLAALENRNGRTNTHQTGNAHQQRPSPIARFGVNATRIGGKDSDS